MDEPNFQDQVRHRKNPDGTGVVIAKYKDTTSETRGSRYINFIDVRTPDDRIIYHTPARNWETVVAYKEDSE